METMSYWKPGDVIVFRGLGKEKIWSEWRWKDEDQLAEVVAMGLYSPAKSREIRAEGERVMRLVQVNQPPFCGGWENWQAPIDWNISCFAEGLNRLS